ncbi:MAG: Hsp20/alpha crystallin family protein [Thermorudis peleae]|nr:Hsp20/alpha crystallin family protein [Thermorudis peleae]
MLIIRRQQQQDAGRAVREVAEFFESWIIGFRPLYRSQSGVWRPPTEVYEDDRGLVIRVEIAGVREEDISVVIDDTVLRVSGVRRPRESGQKRTYYEMGIFYGPFATEVLLPFAIELDAVDAMYDQGFLEVVLPRVRTTRVVPLRITDSTAQEGTNE